ncbi:MAG: hypothetical protein J6B43_02460 [Lachnospiraceae bacterium]|nr:hypothetical protein [Lachnospiraceae bacterium]
MEELLPLFCELEHQIFLLDVFPKANKQSNEHDDRPQALIGCAYAVYDRIVANISECIAEY